jgi:hypothetical protein
MRKTPREALHAVFRFLDERKALPEERARLQPLLEERRRTAREIVPRPDQTHFDA